MLFVIFLLGSNFITLFLVSAFISIYLLHHSSLHSMLQPRHFLRSSKKEE